jgi:hypothetical protein
MTRPRRLLVTGGMILDSVVTADGQVSLERMGGNAVYGATGACLWSDAVAVAANVPSNYPQEHIDALHDAGIGIGGVRRHEHAVDEAEWFLHEADGSRLDHVYAPRRLFPHAPEDRLSRDEKARWAEELVRRSPEGLTFGGFRKRHPVTVAQAIAAAPAPALVHLAPEAVEAQQALAQAFKAVGATVMLDPGFAALRGSADRLAALFADVDILLPSERELLALAPADDPAEAARALAARTGVRVVAKLGRAGALVVDPATRALTRIPAISVDAIDPVGAGDSFCGGFAAGFLATGDPILAALHGTVSASIAVSGFGALHALATPPGEAEARLRALASAVSPAGAA